MAAFIAPPVVISALLLRSGQRSWLDDAVLLATGLLLPVYRLMRGSLATRSRADARHCLRHQHLSFSGGSA